MKSKFGGARPAESSANEVALLSTNRPSVDDRRSPSLASAPGRERQRDAWESAANSTMERCPEGPELARINSRSGERFVHVAERSDSDIDLPIARLFRDETHIRIFPAAYRHFSQEHHMVFRIGCGKITTLTTSLTGIKAINLLQAGKTLGETKTIIAAAQGVSPQSVNLDPLLRALLKARMIRSVDDVWVETECPLLRRAAFQRLQLLLLGLRESFNKAIMRHAPTRPAHYLGFVVRSALRGQKWRRTYATSRSNFEGVLGAFLPARAIDAMTSDYLREKTRRSIDITFLRHMPKSKMVSWLQGAAEFTGLERLEAGIAQGHGTILCGFHFSAAEFLLPLLWLRGCSFVGAGSYGPIVDKEVPTKLLLNAQSLKEGIVGCGSVTWFSKFSFQGVLEILRALQKGQTALVFLDGYFDRPNREIAEYFGNLAAEYQPAQTALNFLGRAIKANTAIAWMSLQSQAPVFPVKVLRKGDSSFHVVIEPPLELYKASSVHAATELLYGALERDIYLHPTQWMYWSRLHDFGVTPAEQNHCQPDFSDGSAAQMRAPAQAL